MIEHTPRILIIDPDERDRAVLTAFLEQEGYRADSGRGLTDAVTKMSTGDFSCLIMDVDLPEMKGYKAVSVLKSIHPGIKVIMTTKKNTKELEAKVREQEIFFYFIKTFGKKELKLAINNAFSQENGGYP
jgi:two-component system response regulator ResD